MNSVQIRGESASQHTGNLNKRFILLLLDYALIFKAKTRTIHLSKKNQLMDLFRFKK
jgi:hypothetical protein